MPALPNHPSTVLTRPTHTPTQNAVQKPSTVTLGRRAPVTRPIAACPTKARRNTPSQPSLTAARPGNRLERHADQGQHGREEDRPAGPSTWKPDRSQSHSHTAGTITKSDTAKEIAYEYRGRRGDSRGSSPATSADIAAEAWGGSMSAASTVLRSKSPPHAANVVRRGTSFTLCDIDV